MKLLLIFALALLPSLSYACLFGADLVQMARMGDLKANKARVLKNPTKLTDLQKKQILAGMKPTLESEELELDKIENAFEATQDKEFVSRRIFDSAHKKAYLLYVYSGGDNVHGFITRDNSDELVAQISDGSIEEGSCKVDFENYDALPWQPWP